MKNRPVINGARDAVDYLMREYALDRVSVPRVYAGIFPYDRYELRVQHAGTHLVTDPSLSAQENSDLSRAATLAAGILVDVFDEDLGPESRGSAVILRALELLEAHRINHWLSNTPIQPTKD